MSTRCTTHFNYGDSTKAIVYRHSDGYPKGAGNDLRRFLQDIADNLEDTRFSDPAYLAARYVVFLVNTFRENAREFSRNIRQSPLKSSTADTDTAKPFEHPLDFLGVGIVMEDPGDIEYRYVVDCGKIIDGLPDLQCYEVGMDYSIPVPLPTAEEE